MRNARLTALFAAALLVGCAATPPPLYEGLGESGREIATDSDLAQQYFDQGLALSWGFNHDEAVRSFQEVARLEPDCAMAQWGIAYALGPNINGYLKDVDKAARAHAAVQRAADLASKTAGPFDVERALIEALTTRFAAPLRGGSSEDNDRGDRGGPLDVAYADAMREVWQRFPDEPMVGTLFADALMNISMDWRAWGSDEERGEHATEIIATLERVLELAPEHAGANHLYMHSVEGSHRPERALASARKLEGLMPAAGHMVHMPSHIYIRLGMYDEAVESNVRAMAEDDRFFAMAPRSGVYHIYRAHNQHFLSWAAMFRGSRDEAMATARAMVSKLPTDSSKYPGIDTYRFIPMHVMMRFGEWEGMLAEPAPARDQVITVALCHHARAVAYANTDRLAEARAEAAAFEAAVTEIPETTIVRRASLEALMGAARHMMWGEILFKEGDHDEAFAELVKGIELEDSMPYAEPPSWMQPIRHSLGALLLEAGRLERAEAVYRADLDRHANNVWSLHGLAESLNRQGREQEAVAVEARFEEVAAHADVPITSSCYCRTPDA